MTKQTKHGFTLIELLVVIAIIAILASILFPVFARARSQARKISCLSNMKQIGTSLMMYIQDYDELYPGSANSTDLDPYLKSIQVFVCPSAQSGVGYAYNGALAHKNESLMNNSSLIIMHGETDTVRHLLGANYSFVDGHVKWLRPDKMDGATAAVS